MAEINFNEYRKKMIELAFDDTGEIIKNYLSISENSDEYFQVDYQRYIKCFDDIPDILTYCSQIGENNNFGHDDVIESLINRLLNTKDLDELEVIKNNIYKIGKRFIPHLVSHINRYEYNNHQRFLIVKILLGFESLEIIKFIINMLIENLLFDENPFDDEEEREYLMYQSNLWEIILKKLYVMSVGINVGLDEKALSILISIFHKTNNKSIKSLVIHYLGSTKREDVLPILADIIINCDDVDLKINAIKSMIFILKSKRNEIELRKNYIKHIVKYFENMPQNEENFVLVKNLKELIDCILDIIYEQSLSSLYINNE